MTHLTYDDSIRLAVTASLEEPENQVTTSNLNTVLNSIDSIPTKAISILSTPRPLPRVRCAVHCCCDYRCIEQRILCKSHGRINAIFGKTECPMAGDIEVDDGQVQLMQIDAGQRQGAGLVLCPQDAHLDTEWIAAVSVAIFLLHAEGLRC